VYERLAWSLRPINVCRKARVLAAEIAAPIANNAFRRDRLDNSTLAACGYDLRQACQPWQATSRVINKRAAAIDLVAQWLTDPPLVGMSMAACFWWLERFGNSGDGERRPWLDQAREGLPDNPFQV